MYPEASRAHLGLSLDWTGNRVLCTLIALHRCLPGAQLVIAANRDEFLDRPSEAPALRNTPSGVIVAPRDVKAGGTWLGLNRTGLFAAVTNLRCPEPDPRRRSRGLLVIDALGAATAEAALEKLERLDSGAYNPFNLFVADRERAFAISYDESPRCIELGPGIHVIGNTDPTGPPTPKLVALTREVERAASAPPERVLDELAAICRGHRGGADPLESACVHAGDYGTRSSTLLRLGKGLEDGTLLHADGPPCRSQYRDLTPLLRELSFEASAVEEATAARTAL